MERIEEFEDENRGSLMEIKINEMIKFNTIDANSLFDNEIELNQNKRNWLSMYFSLFSTLSDVRFEPRW